MTEIAQDSCGAPISDPGSHNPATNPECTFAPGIEEPTGLGAVVEDAKGWRWVRIYGDPNYEWQYLTKIADYEDIAVVRVLSAGVDV